MKLVKPWTVSRGPIAASEYDLKKAESINTLLVRPLGILPIASGDQIKPFAIGLFDEIRRQLKPDCALTALRRAVGAYVNSKSYIFASAQPDSMRHNIDGQPIEPLSQEARLFAQQRFLTMRSDNTPVARPAPPKSEVPAAMSKTDLIRAALLKPQSRKTISSR